MTQTTPPADPAWSAPPAEPVVIARPGMVTAAGITLIVLGVLTILLGLLLLLGAALFAGAGGSIEAPEMPGMGGMFGAFAGIIFVLAFIVAGFGVLQLLSGIKVLAGRNWARITGIVVAAIAGVLALTGLGQADGAILNIVLLVANAFVIFALVTAGSWFSARLPDAAPR